MSNRASNALRAKKSRFLKKESLNFEGRVEEPVEKRRKISDAELGDSSRLSGSNLSDNEYTSSVTAHYDVPMKIENTDSNASGQFPESSTMEDRILATVQTLVKESEERIIRKIESVKRNLLYDLRVKTEEINTNFQSASGFVLGLEADESTAILGVKLPVETLEEFNVLEEVLKTPEKAKAMKTLMRTKLSGKADIKFEVGRILSHILGHPVQLLYSACGKESKVSGKVTKKLNFSKTYTYTYMLDVLSEKFQGNAGILSATSRWLSGAGDRNHGRSLRQAQ